MLLFIDLNGAQVDGAFSGGVGKTAVDDTGHSDEDEENSDYFHARSILRNDAR